MTAALRPAVVLPYALAYAERGWEVFPIRGPRHDGDRPACSCRDRFDCGQIGKHPRVLWATGTPDHPELWQRPATTDPATIRAWWARWPDDNVGIRTGEGSGIIVVDVDKDAGGYDTLGRLDAQHGWAWSTARVLTPTGGAHFYYRCPPGSIPSSTHTSRTAGGRTDPFGPGMDLHGTGGMVVAPPSLHRNGGRYQWQHDLVPGGDRHVADLP
jgi:putative DNA primase/helicase